MSTRGAPAWTRPRWPQATYRGLPRDRAGAARRAVVRRRDRPGRGAGQGQQARPTRLVGDRGPGAQRRALAALGSRERLPVISFGLALTRLSLGPHPVSLTIVSETRRSALSTIWRGLPYTNVYETSRSVTGVAEPSYRPLHKPVAPPLH